MQRLGARFAMPRDAVVELLETARAALDGTGTALEASSPQPGPRAAPLRPRAARAGPPVVGAGDRARAQLDDPATLAACLLARHDVLWTPGRAGERIDLAREIADLADAHR